MAQRLLQESEKDGRSVLGMLTVQVERDPVGKSVAPVSTPASGTRAITVFDDSRKSIRAVDGSGYHPSPEELAKILSVIDGVGMQVMLDEVTVTPNEAQPKLVHTEVNRVPVKEMQPGSKENYMPSNSHTSPNSEAQLTTEVASSSMRSEEEANVMVVREVTMEDRDLEASPITLMFLGYTDSTNSQEDSNMLTAERVIITEDGEEHSAADQEVGKESPSDMYQGVPLKENDQTSQVQEDHANKESSSPAVEEPKGPSKHKTCQCCSVM
ncbi:uncharacterized protein LOC133465986 [Phyllopteryx taeniolatus]|uniref:uncharacterized protein LOC133465986 n=1 Tax=Phyllopteryx taeniolatus TaxID=161469 RepID=UPI002AD4AF6E|nr:uncharacterized protein LOC133465986 [Phyllopteryx taeniolatus]